MMIGETPKWIKMKVFDSKFTFCILKVLSEINFSPKRSIHRNLRDGDKVGNSSGSQEFFGNQERAISEA